MVTDSISDLLIRIKNAQAVKKESVIIPYTSLVWDAAKILEKNGYLSKIDRRGKNIRRVIEARLSYDEKGGGRISGAKRVSKPSRRVYAKYTEIFPVKHGAGAMVISTSKGLMTDEEARKEKIGGEVLFVIW